MNKVCYSFWVLSALSILQKLSYIDSGKLVSFILSAQDSESGGIADRPGDMPDVFHTLFGVAGLQLQCLSHNIFTHWYARLGLSLLGYSGLQDLDPVYCMPAPLIERLGLRKQWKGLPQS